MKLVALSFLLSFASIPREALSHPIEIPREFIGEWNSDLKNCSRNRGDGRLRITSEHIQFHESAGPILSARQQGANDLHIDVLLSGEGETNVVGYRFRLSDDRSRLTDVTGNRKFIRYRCSQGENDSEVRE